MLSKCQKEFETDFYKDVNYEKEKATIDEEEDEVKRKEKQELLEERLSKAKRRSLGNIRFIGELFKLSMLTDGIMHDCINRLLKIDNDEENLECLCKLLTTIGKDIDKQSAAKSMKEHFDKLDKMIGKSTKKPTANVSSRIRFMILDVIELRQVIIFVSLSFFSFLFLIRLFLLLEYMGSTSSRKCTEDNRSNTS